jgi:GT2 family glycosyltransferase
VKIDILVLNYNGKDLLKENLGSVCAAAGKSKHECAVYVVDNVSVDGSIELLEKEFPEVRIIRAGKNRVLCSYNEAVASLSSDVVVFLNNDMAADDRFVDLLAAEFEDKKVMFAAPRIMNFDGTYNGGRSRIEFSNGVVKVAVESEKAMEKGRTQAISTGAFRRGLFLEFGGFDDLYLPGIWEDVDICYRAAIAGYKGVYVPDSVIYHNESTTFHRVYGRKKKMMLAHRNMFLFVWKNLRDPGMLAQHLLLLFPRAFLLLVRGNYEVLWGLAEAFKRIPMVLGKRKAAGAGRSGFVLKDRDVMNA